MPQQQASSDVHLGYLPSQTTATFYLILLVFLGTLLSALIGPSPVCMTPVVLSLLVLPVRAVLATPRREMTLEDKAATEALKAQGLYQKVQETIDALAAEAGFGRPIRLLVSRRPHEARATGSWRRHYILLGSSILEQIAHDLDHPDHREKARALLLHEIGHHVHRDVQRIRYAGELLKSSATLLPWWTLFLVGWLSFALLMGEAFLGFDIHSVNTLTPEVRQMLAPLVDLSPAQRTQITNQIQNVSLGLLLGFLINAFLPIIVIGFVLWLFFWRRMVRLQEYYADGLVRSHGFPWEALAAAMGRYPDLLTPASPAPSSLGVWLQQTLIQPVRKAVQPLGFFRRLPGEKSYLNRWFALHPTYRQRVLQMRDPQRLFEGWQSVAWSTAILVLALDVMLVNPLTSYHLAAFPVHMSTLGIFLMVSTWFLPFLASNRPFRRPLLFILLIIFAVRWIWLLINAGLLPVLALFVPSLATEILNLTIITGARSAVLPETLLVLDPLQESLALLPRLFALQTLQLGGVVLLLGVYYKLQKNVARRAPATQWRPRHWLIVVGLSSVVGALFLTPLSDLISARTTELLAPSRIALYAVGLLVGFASWYRINRQELA